MKLSLKTQNYNSSTLAGNTNNIWEDHLAVTDEILTIEMFLFTKYES